MRVKPSHRGKTNVFRPARIVRDGSPPTVRSLLDRFLCDSMPSALGFRSRFSCICHCLQPRISTSSSGFTTPTLWRQRSFDSTSTAGRIGHGRRLCACTRLRKTPHHRRRLCQNRPHRVSGHFRESRFHNLATQNGYAAEALHS